MANEPPESAPPAQKKLEELEEHSKDLEQMQHRSEMAWAMAGVSSSNEALKDFLRLFSSTMRKLLSKCWMTGVFQSFGQLSWLFC